MDALGLHAPSGMPEASKPALRVLVIDDDERVGAAIRSILARRESETKLAVRAHAGIHALETSRFDVVLIDLFMPGMSGLDAIAHIRRKSEIPIIAMSGFWLRNSLNSRDYFSMAIERGASTSIRKPFAPQQLIEAIRCSLTSAPSTKRVDAMTQGSTYGVQAGEFEIDHSSPERARTANEVGAAIAHELNGPLTALLLYVGDLSQNSDRLPAANGNGQSLKQVVESVLRETERICFLLQRIGDAFEAPLQNETAFARGREIIRWWSRVGNRNGGDTEAQAARAIQNPLTPREREVLRLVCEGCSNKEGGVRMKISYRTFESHRANVMRKFGAKNAADLTRLSLLNFESFNSDRSGTTGDT